MRVSSRLPPRLETNALTATLARMKAEGTRVLDLTVSNPVAAGLRFPGRALRAALGSASVCRYAPDPQGDRRAREAVAAWHGQGVDPDGVFLVSSTSEAYAWLFKLLCDPGEEVIVPCPGYPLFEWLARLEGVSAKPVPACFHEGWHLDLEAMERAVGAGTRALVAVNPDNPTGHFLSQAEWAGLLDLCARKGLALIVDEVFADYPLEATEDHLSTALEASDPPCPLFVLSGLSKVAALPQVKLAWIVARGAQARQLLEPLSFLADQYLSVSASAQAAAPRLLALAPGIQARIRARLRANLATLDGALPVHPALARLPVEGGWTVLLRRPAVDPDEDCVLGLLRETRTIVHPGHFFDLPGDGYLVLSLLTDERTFGRGLVRILPRLS